MRTVAVVVPIVCAGIAMPAIANAQSKLTAMVELQGTCRKLVVGGKVRTSDCTGKLLNTEYSDARLGFYFVTADGSMLTFSTRGEQQVKTDENTAVVPVDMLLVTAKGKTDKVQAVGTCKFTNPYRGIPAPIECAASAASGRYEATFLSDGSKPEGKTFD